MARNIHSRLKLTGTLVTESPLHVGGHGQDVDTDMPLARDGAGRLYIPGTSLAGALRRWCERAFDAPGAAYDQGNQFTETMWGYQDRRPDQEDGQASHVVVEDMVVENESDLIVTVRDGVGIDREYGAAAKHIKHDRAILPCGARMPLEISLESESAESREKALAMLAGLKSALQDTQIRIGGGRTRGLGRISLEEGATITEERFDSRQHVLEFLRNGPALVAEEERCEAVRKHLQAGRFPRLTFTLGWQPVGPLMVKAGYDGITADMLPLTDAAMHATDKEVKPTFSLLLPGSAIKGAMRSQAERIVRTVLGDTGSCWVDHSDDKQRFLKSVEVPLVVNLFGQHRKPDDADRVNESDAGENPDPSPGLGALSVWDCHGKRGLDRDKWRAIEEAKDDGALRTALEDAELEPWTESYHVAVDRWLGSAAEGMLFSVLEPHGAAWEDITFEVDLARLPGSLQKPSVALLLLLVRDLAGKRLPLGFATHRGMGELEIKSATITGGDLPDELDGLSKLPLNGGDLSGLPEKLRMELDLAWQSWRQELTQEQAR